MANYLLDSTVLIQLWRMNPNASRWLREALERADSVATSAVNVAEVYAGARPGDLSAWDEFFGDFRIHVVTAADGVWAGRRKFELKQAGRRIELPDALIAAVAHSRNAIVATENRRDFEALGVAMELVRGS